MHVHSSSYLVSPGGLVSYNMRGNSSESTENVITPFFNAYSNGNHPCLNNLDIMSISIKKLILTPGHIY